MLNELAQRIYDFNKTMGWHSGEPNLAVYLMNLHSEISELWEAWREGKVISRGPGPTTDSTEKELCDKSDKMIALGVEPLTCLEEELADVLIRTLDTAHAFGVDIDRAVASKMAYNATRAHRHGGKLA